MSNNTMQEWDDRIGIPKELYKSLQKDKKAPNDKSVFGKKKRPLSDQYKEG